MNNLMIKESVRDNILLAINHLVTVDVLGAIQHAIEEQLVNVDVKPLETLPATVDNSTDEQNKYIIELFALKKINLAKGTKYAYLSAVKNLITKIDKPLTKMTDIDISYYLKWYEERNERQGGKRNQASTVNNERRFLSAFFSFMRRSKLISENPVESTENLKVLPKPIDFFSGKEMETLRDGCESLRDRALLEGLRSTGLRVGEFENINIADVDWFTGDVRVQREKGGENTPAYLDDVASHHMKEYLKSRADDNQALIVGIKAPHKRLTRAGIRSVMKQIASRQDLMCRVYPHKMRKTLGMNMINKGADIGTVQAVLGHRDPATTSRFYAQLTPESLRDIRRKAA